MARGCGVRKVGGIYFEVGLSPYGQPLENFIVCPPIAVDLQAWGAAKVGQTLIERDGVTHILDYVGSKYYPNVADCLEEGRVQGFSRRAGLASAKDYARINANTRLLLVHAHAQIDNFQQYINSMRGELERRTVNCPRRHDEHRPANVPLEEMCGGLWYHDVEGEMGPLLPEDENFVVAGAKVREAIAAAGGGDFDDALPRIGRRTTPGCSYVAHRRPEGLRPKYRTAIFASLPITRIVLVDPDGAYGEKARKARSAGVPFEIVEA